MEKKQGVGERVGGGREKKKKNNDKGTQKKKKSKKLTDGDHCHQHHPLTLLVLPVSGHAFAHFAKSVSQVRSSWIFALSPPSSLVPNSVTMTGNLRPKADFSPKARDSVFHSAGPRVCSADQPIEGP